MIFFRIGSALMGLLFARAVKNPKRHQEKLWSKTYTLLSQSAFWKKNNLKKDLHENPITIFSFYEEALKNDYQKSHSSLNGRPILHWAESSGSTGSIKLFPLTKIYRWHLFKVTGAFIASLFKRFPRHMESSVLYLAAPLPKEKFSTGISRGLITGYWYKNIQHYFMKKYTFPKILMMDQDLYKKWRSYYAVASDVDTIMAMAPGKITELLKEINAKREELKNLLFDSSLLPTTLPEAKVSAERLDYLIRLLTSDKKIKGEDLWPKLHLIICWKTGACALQLPELDLWITPTIPRVDSTYGSTEGFFTVPLSNEKNGGVAHPSSIIYEFIEEGKEIVKENLIPLHEIQVGKTYEIFLTNTMGLVRYRIFDIIRCTGFYEQTPILEFVRKSSRLIQLGWTRISEADLYSAFSKISYAGDPSPYFSFASNQKNDGLILYQHNGVNIDASHFDQALREINGYYNNDRSSGMVQPLEVLLFDTNPKGHLQSKPTLIHC